MLDNARIARAIEQGWEVKALVRGHVQRIQKAVREKAPAAPAQ